jgi:tRNA-dihydrouridine synthase A
MVYKVSIAPMMDRTDRHFRYFLRLMSGELLLYSEMVVAQAVLQGDRQRLLGFDPREAPLVLQLGGNDPELLAQAARVGADWGYTEINLNIGCPSDRVQSGRFGACLMAEPQRVADSVQAIAAEVNIPVSVKTRIGIDAHEDYGFLQDFIGQVHAGGCTSFIVHARKAILAGLSPAENRAIPPLKYARVYRLKADFPDLLIVVNGGIRESPAAIAHLQHVDGVMIGRQAYKEPYWVAELAESLSENKLSVRPERGQLVSMMADYAERALGEGARMHHITRHMLGLYAGVPGARAWRRFLAEESRKANAGPEMLVRSLNAFA